MPCVPALISGLWTRDTTSGLFVSRSQVSGYVLSLLYLSDLRQLCARLKAVYEQYDSLEEALAASPYPNPVTKIQDVFRGIQGIPVLTGTSACKRLAMFLRWMVRKDGIVDFGIWGTSIQPHELIIPLDTHVHQISLELGLTEQKVATLKTAVEITEALKKVFPDDPCLGDFALFGYDINREK